MFFDNLVKLCVENNTTPNAVCIAVGLSEATQTKWRKGAVPRDTTLKRIADYFGVSTTELLTGEKDSIPRPSTPPFISYRHDNETAKKMLADMKGLGLFNTPTQKEKPTDYGELKENVVIYHRDGKTVKKTFTKEQMAILRAMLDAAPDDDDEDDDI